MRRSKTIGNNGLQPYTYIWTKISNGINEDIVVRITICCGEYIVGITLYDTRSSVNNEEDRIKKRDLLSFPNQGIYQWYGNAYRFNHYVDKIVFDRVTNTPIELTTQEFKDFLDGDNSKLNIEHIKFLYYNIIETLTNKRNEYYELLTVFRELYNEGYWTYGGFKDFVGTNNRMENKVKVNYLFRPLPRRSFILTKDGKVRGDNIDLDVKETLEMLGATVI